VLIITICRALRFQKSRTGAGTGFSPSARLSGLEHGSCNRLFFDLCACVKDFKIEAPGLVEIEYKDGMESGRQGNGPSLFLIAVQAVVVHDQCISDVQATAVIGVGEECVDIGFRNLDIAGVFEPEVFRLFARRQSPSK
jgi:hypothetical protein